ncbi:ubiquitin elongating factor [Nitzschia inconspicua]|uniref:RING-type E3 ubiquitin transferase n=1 Tax=Nitzschia inconspicua TaxID=303405 RepID=A0A9K3LTQ0_9STRA|nr:ubiquitin elongating factor [Nitzschia inconspicua]
MSGLLPDLASWALRGGAGNTGGNNGNGNGDDNNDEQNSNNNNGKNAAPPEPAMTEEEMRARRLARMEAMQKKQQQEARAAVSTSTSSEPQPMEVEETPSPKVANASAAAVAPMDTDTSSSSYPPLSKKAKEMHHHHHNQKSPSSSGKKSLSSLDPARKLQRKLELVIKKVLNITLGSKKTDSTCIPIDLGDIDGDDDDGTESSRSIGVHTIAEILATRLSLPVSILSTTTPPQKPLIQYLASAHQKAADEAKSMRQNAASAEKYAPILDILQEIQNQVVSYASSSLMEPDLFEQASDSQDQLYFAFVAQTSTSADLSASMTFGVNGTASSFYHQLCDELFSQDPAAFDHVIGTLATGIMTQLKSCDSLESTPTISLGSGPSQLTTTTSPLGLVTALQAICGHKKAALAVSGLPCFLLPPEGSPAATETVRPPMSAGTDLLRILTGDENRPYKKRSGVGLEKDTLLGLVLRVSTPKNNPAFSPTNILRQSMSTIEQATNQQRQSLRAYQVACTQLVMSFIKAGPNARGQVMQWFVDCMLMNPGATAMRPDSSKVSSQNMLLNTSIILLKLCEPFVLDDKKHYLIDPGFVSSAKDNQGVFPISGDDALPRLGERISADTSDPKPYAPKNAFIPQCFFYTARSLALAIVPMLSQHEYLLRHISHMHWELRNRNQDIQSEPRFSILMARQRSNEVALFQEEMVVDTLRFSNLMAKVIFEMDDDNLRQMPEHFVNNICDIVMNIADLKPKLLRGMEFRYTFSMVVKLLSPKYAGMVRNYNLRATLGDVLYDLYLPSDDQDSRRRDVPSTISHDPLKGGQPYLTSDEEAQETLAPSLLLLYGEVEHTGYYDKMSHRAKISSLIKYLWESKEHRSAFQKITQNKESFITFANGIINETNQLITNVMQKLPTIKQDQDTMADASVWGNMSEEEQSILTSRLSDNEREVKHALPLCNKTMQMLGYLNTEEDIRSLFLLEELCGRLVGLLNHVLQKIIGGKGMELKVRDPEQYDFRPKELLRDLCAIFALFSTNPEFQMACAEAGCKPSDLRSAVSKCHKYSLLTGKSMADFDALPDAVEKAAQKVAEEEVLLGEIPEEFTDPIVQTLMRDPVVLPSGNIVDRHSIRQQLLNNPLDPFSRAPMTIDDVKPATELKTRIDAWVKERLGGRDA